MRTIPLSTRLVAIIVLLVLTLALIPIVISQEDELERLYKSWIEGKPLVLVRLDTKIPEVDADECLVVVGRFPTKLNPSPNGRLEYLYIEFVSPGSVVTVKKYIPAIPIKLKYDEEYRSYIVEYYEPQEFFLIIHCTKGNETVLNFGRIIEVYPKSLIHREVVDVAKLIETTEFTTQKRPITYEEIVSRDEGITTASGDIYRVDEGIYNTNSQVCNITIIETRTGYRRGECRTWIRGPYLYSIEGLKTSFCLYHYPRPSAVYLTAFSGSTLDPINPPPLSSSGKRLTPTSGSGCSSELTGYSRVRLYFFVKYVYEEFTVCGVLCRTIALLYPDAINRVNTTSAEPPESYPPPRYRPYCANGPFVGDWEQSFAEGGVYESDTPISSISVTFSIPSINGIPIPVSLNVEFYKAGRDDSQYTTPYIKMIDVSGKTYQWYYWWYKYCDSMTYEIIFST